MQTDYIIQELNNLIDHKKEKTKEITEEMLGKFQGIQTLIQNLGWALAIAGILIAFLTTRTIVSPVRKIEINSTRSIQRYFPLSRGLIREGR